VPVASSLSAAAARSAGPAMAAAETKQGGKSYACCYSRLTTGVIKEGPCALAEETL
jgi:uncharacterized protein (DUF2336 family)